MHTSIVLLALSASWLANIPVTPKWEADYSTARLIVSKSHKPLAVFVGSGDASWRQLTHEGQPDAEVAKLLSEEYVRVYVNADTKDGREFAASFGLTGTQGLVISNRTGDFQAFRHDGDLPAKELAKQLTRYSSPDHVVRMTESVATQNAATAAPAATVFPYSNYQLPSYGGCPNCRH
jgi:hypothetical protein